MAMLSDREAKAVVDSFANELGLSPGESLVVRMVAKHETQYGAGWDAKNNPPREERGAGSFNWGANTTTSSAPGTFFVHGDSRFDEKTGKVIPYETKFAKYQSHAQGARGLALVLLFNQSDARRGRRGNMVDAIASRSIAQVATAMRMNRYFLGVKPFAEAVEDYRRGLEKRYREIQSATGEDWFDFPKAAGSSPSAAAAAGPSSGSASSDSALSYLQALSRSLPAVRVGSIGNLIEVMQYELGELEPDGRFGPKTQARLVAFQRDSGLESDVDSNGRPVPLGVCGVKTWSLLFADNVERPFSGEELERVAELRSPEQTAELEQYASGWREDDNDNPAA